MGTQAREAIGRSRGGFTTKLHARCDGKGRPLGFVLTPGQAHYVHGFAPLFRMLTHKVKALLADRGYDADAIRGEIAFPRGPGGDPGQARAPQSRRP